MDLTAEEWLGALQMQKDEIPDAVIVEGSWWRAQRNEWRLSYLQDVRELHFPDIFWGRWRGRKIAYCCAYGAPRTNEIIHLFAILGVRLAIQIGTCGGLAEGLQPGDIILPRTAACREGVAQLYGATEISYGDEAGLHRAHHSLQQLGRRSLIGPHLTWASLFAQRGQDIQQWHEEGFLGVDMETATTYAVANHFNVPAISLLVVWDLLLNNRSFLDPLSDAEQNELDRSNEAVYTVALDLIQSL
ncbi:MAG: hypothetical protein OXF22_01920 [Anaerolineaceae bacterium]|nr:hypothetical protein [Anaerolineaceae bacterium]